METNVVATMFDAIVVDMDGEESRKGYQVKPTGTYDRK